MAKRNNYTPYNLGKIKKHNANISKFLGVDYSTQKFLISSGHALDLKNYIYKDGIVRKRRGFEQILEIKNFTYIPASFENKNAIGINEIHTNQNEKQINGVWSFEAEDGNIHTVAHIGRLMYEIKNLEDPQTISAMPITSNSTAIVDSETHELAFEFENFKSFAFVGGKRLWFLGGNKYMCLRFYKGGNNTVVTSFVVVEDSVLAPIPTTTISITYKNSISSGRATLDRPNILTKWRYNKLLSGTTKAEDEKQKTTFYEYTLDAPIIKKTERDMANIEISLEERGVSY